MPTPSAYLSEELLEDFDDKLWQLKVDGELDREVSRSEFMRRLIKEWVEERDDIPPE